MSRRHLAVGALTLMFCAAVPARPSGPENSVSNSPSWPAPADTVIRGVTQPVHPGVATLVEEMSIGVADGAEEYMLGEVADIALGADGSLYVFDRQVPAVRHYGTDGKFIRTIGRRGQGPGEYGSASGLAMARDGRLLIWDTGNWRINVYAASGDFITQWSTPSGSGGSSSASYWRALMVDTAGRVVTRKESINFRDVLDRPTLWIRYRLDGTVLDTLTAPPSPLQTARVSAVAGNVRVSNEVPFSPRRLVVLSPLGDFVAGYPDRYAFEIHRPGQPVLSVRREVKADPVSRAERTAARQRIEERMRRTDPSWSWNGPDIPDAKPLYAGLDVGLEGRIWVALVPEVGPRAGSVSGGGGVGSPRGRSAQLPSDGQPPHPALYDVFEPDGRYLGQVQVPAKVSTVARRGDIVWAVGFDEDDVPHIKRFRIAWRQAPARPGS